MMQIFFSKLKVLHQILHCSWNFHQLSDLEGEGLFFGFHWHGEIQESFHYHLYIFERVRKYFDEF